LSRNPGNKKPGRDDQVVRSGWRLGAYSEVYSTDLGVVANFSESTEFEMSTMRPVLRFTLEPEIRGSFFGTATERLIECPLVWPSLTWSGMVLAYSAIPNRSGDLATLCDRLSLEFVVSMEVESVHVCRSSIGSYGRYYRLRGSVVKFDSRGKRMCDWTWVLPFLPNDQGEARSAAELPPPLCSAWGYSVKRGFSSCSKRVTVVCEVVNPNLPGFNTTRSIRLSLRMILMNPEMAPPIK
jgi:hypothetical protein